MTTTKISKAQKEQRDDMLNDFSNQIEEYAENLKRAVGIYAAYVWSGGDPTKVPEEMPEGFAQSYGNPVSPFVQRIVNTYRLSVGKKANPYHPWTIPFKGFDFLLEHEGEWVLGKSLRGKIYGQMVDTYFNPNHLKGNGWLLQKRSISNKVHYRLVTYESVYGFTSETAADGA